MKSNRFARSPAKHRADALSWEINREKVGSVRVPAVINETTGSQVYGEPSRLLEKINKTSLVVSIEFYERISRRKSIPHFSSEHITLVIRSLYTIIPYRRGFLLAAFIVVEIPKLLWKSYNCPR